MIQESAPTAQQPAAQRRRRIRRPSTGVLAIVLVALAYASVIQSFSWNQTSHYALVRSLGHGTAHIDQYQGTTGDKAFFEGHWYSSRAPGLAIYALPWYGLLTAVNAPQVARASPAQHHDDEMVWAVGLWGNVLPALVIMLLVRWLAERLEPGTGTITAVAVGFGTLLLPLGTLLFSHVFSACLGFAAFVLLWRDRDGPRRLWRPALAGLLVGYAMVAEYPLLFVAIVLGAYLLVDRDRIRRLAAYGIGAVVGIAPLAIYDQLAFGSVWHVAYADLPPHQSGFFGIRPPDLSAAASILISSRGLFTLAPLLALGVWGIFLLYRRGRRAEAVSIAAICLLYVGYNAGYYLPFGGAVPGPRFLMTMLPFLAVPVALAWRRAPGPTLALASISAVTMVLATVTHPLVGYQGETAAWTRYAANGFFQPTIASALGAGRGWLSQIPFAVFAVAALAIAAITAPRLWLSRRTLAAGAAAAAVWALAATTLPHLLGIDSATERRIAESGDPMIVARYYHLDFPLLHLVLLAVGIALLALIAARVISRRRPAQSSSPTLVADEPALQTAP